MSAPRFARGWCVLLILGSASCWTQRDEPALLRRPYNTAFYSRHHRSYELQAAFHFAHAKQHDVLELSPLSEGERVDRDFDREIVHAIDDPPRIGPEMAYYTPHSAQLYWNAMLTIDWTHEHHVQTYDVLADDRISWREKAAKTQRALDVY